MPDEIITPEAAHDTLVELNAIAATAHDGRIENDLASTVRWKRFKFVVKEVNEDGTFSGYASVWGVLDSDQEVVDRGSCLRSLKNNPNFVLLWQHDTKTPVGFAVDAHEDDYGLKLTGELMLDCEAGRYAYSFLKKAQKVKGRAGLSIGFRVIQDQMVKEPKSGKTFRHFTEIQLMETSIVTFQANPASFVTDVKSKFLSAPPVEETTKKDKSSMSTDFNTALQDRARQRELSKHRSDIEDALYDTLSAVHGSDLDLNAKKAAIKDTYQKHGAAMADWHIKSYFGDGAKSYDVELHRKSDGQLVVFEKAAPAVLDIKSISAEEFAEVFKTFTPEQSAVIVKGKLSAAAQATMNHALQMHSSAIELHGKAMKICKDAFGDDSTPVISGTEMGAMSDQGAIDGKSQEEKTGGTKNNSSVLNNEPPQQTTDGDPGIHSLLDDLRKSQTRRLESL